MEEIARRIEGRRIHARTRLILTMSPPVKAEAQRLGIAERIERAGGMLSAGNCFYVMTPHVLKERHGWHTIVTNSAKLANIIEGSGYNPVLRRLDICLEAAASGRIPGEAA
ncbi:MAG: DUF521 domain-containing protein [Gammaproteobacteria bacterium]|nr:DUF521 domain-containing protein [Gammaproteobacteria bacterium]NIV20081.1 DUF521 domain-containing protein [Gammaproteobacteria bacterium]